MNWLFSNVSRRPGKREPATTSRLARRRRTFRPAVEILERRDVPSVTANGMTKKAPSSVTTAIYDSGGGAVTDVLGEKVYDTAKVTAAPYTPTGTVTYDFYTTASPIYGTTTPSSTQTVTLSGGVVPNSATTAALTAGSYAYIAVYSGDGYCAGVVSAVEPLWINKGSSSVSTAIYNAATNQPISGNQPSGTSVYDTAKVSGTPFTPTGTLTYDFYTTANPVYGTTTPSSTHTVTLSGGVVPNSAATGALMAGSYAYIGVYSGDSNYKGFTGPVEPLTIKAPSSVTTVIYCAATNTPISGNQPLGTAVYDTATVSATPFTPTGTVTYYFYTTASPVYGTTTPSSTQTVTLSGGIVPKSATTAALTAGSYAYIAVYSGDSNCSGIVSPVEPLWINKGSSSVSTAIYNAATNQPISGNQPSGTSVYDTATVTGTPFTPTGTVTYYFYTTATPVYSTTTPSTTQTVTLSSGAVPNSKATGALMAGSYAYIGVYSGDSNYAGFVSAVEPLTVTVTGTPKIVVTKTADKATIVAGQTAGFTVTITNNGTATATGVTLTDPLPPGAAGDIDWMIDSSTGNPTDFTLTGAVGSQSLVLSSSLPGDSLAAGQSISVHITGVTTANDTNTSTNPALNVGGLAGYAVLYEGTGNNQLSITNDTVDGNIGVGGGQVQFNGPGTIGGRLDFAAANTGQYHNTNGSDVGPTSVNYGVSAVTTAINAANSLSTSLGALSGSSITFTNNSQTINESSGMLESTGGATYRVFSVSSYSANNSTTVTINGDGSGDPVVFNFAYSSNTNLGGQIVLTGGLTADQVIWNFTSSGKNVQLNNNGGTYQGVILLPNDNFTSNSYNLDGRVYGGADGNMQIVSGANIYVPPMVGMLTNTATVKETNESGSQSATATITINAAVAQLAAGSSSSAGTGIGELLGSSQLQAGTLGVAIDLPQGPETGAEAAAIGNAIATLDSQLAPLGINLVEASGADAAAAPIHITMAATSPIGGVDQGVLGAFTSGGDITLVSGWNWYFSSDAGNIAQDQYDFQTVVTHELGHALGLGESSDPASVMYLYLTAGQVRNGLTATDLDTIRQELPANLGPLAASAASADSDPVLPPLAVAPVPKDLSPSLPQDITLVQAENLGAEPAGIAANQYDFATLPTHSVGLGEGIDATSVLSSYLGTGNVLRNLTANDLVFIEHAQDAGPGSLRALAASTGLNPGDLTDNSNADLASLTGAFLAERDPLVVSGGRLGHTADSGVPNDANASVLQVPLAASNDSSDDAQAADINDADETP